MRMKRVHCGPYAKRKTEGPLSSTLRYPSAEFRTCLGFALRLQEA